jgi:hypothetical protein
MEQFFREGYDPYTDVDPLPDEYLSEKIAMICGTNQHEVATLADLAIMTLVRQQVLPVHEAQRQIVTELMEQQLEVRRLQRAHEEERQQQQQRLLEMKAEEAAARRKRAELASRDDAYVAQIDEAIVAALYHFRVMPSEQDAARLQSFTEWLHQARYEYLVDGATPPTTIVRAGKKSRACSTYHGVRPASPDSGELLKMGQMISLLCPFCGSSLSLAMDVLETKVGLTCHTAGCLCHDTVLHTSTELELTACCADADDEACVRWESSPHLVADPRCKNLARRPQWRGGDSTDACQNIVVLQSPAVLAAAQRGYQRSSFLSQDIIGYHACASCARQLAHGMKRPRGDAASEQCSRREYRALGCCERFGCTAVARFRAAQGLQESTARHLWSDTSLDKPSTYCLNRCAHCERSVCKDHVSRTSCRKQEPSLENKFSKRKYMHFCVDCIGHAVSNEEEDDL